MTLVENKENPIKERKKSTSRESRTPFWNPSKCVITLKEVMVSTNQELAQPSSNRVIGGKPAKMKKRQMTTDKIKLTT